jgi:hypothetical protein
MKILALLAEALRRLRSRKVTVLVAGLLVIAGWQASFASLPPSSFDTSRRVTASVGIQTEPRFFFFLYHLGLYPIATIRPPKVDTRAEAERLLREEPKTLIQEAGLTFASGERGRAYLYFVDALLRHDRIDPTLRPANALAFGLVLCGLFFSFWWVGRPVMGALLVALLGSNPFQLDAIHGQDNVFSWGITAMIGLLALHVPLLGPGRKSRRLVLGIAIATGLFMALVRMVRSEPMPMLAAPLLVYATLSRAKLRERVLPIVAALGVFTAAGWLMTWRIEAKLRHAQEVIAAAGGTPYTGPVVHHHEVWHPVFCGLGDFDETHGYAWDDRVAYAYVLRVAEARAGKKLGLNPHFWAQRDSYDGAGLYPVPFHEKIPDYHQIVRGKVLGDIRRDPGWYLGILRRRVERILTETTPIALTARSGSIALSAWWIGPACVALLVFLVVRGRWSDVKLLLFATPLSAAALFVYSGRGMTSYSSFHVVGAAIVLSLVAERLARWIRSWAPPT